MASARAGRRSDESIQAVEALCPVDIGGFEAVDGRPPQRPLFAIVLSISKMFTKLIPKMMT
ncbi:hypothetical protein [Variovorax sp. PBL-E5]|uniref:hypothetical protein n=1 Tax=Variovorax sp. PBL-E5 TaxID=434014 RepID=UPI0013A544E3|nr:hypothetical protein [Variovorax sp. PBL-E5]